MRGLVWIKGAGDLATGVAYRLLQAGFQTVLSELPEPLCVRRTVSFAEAVWSGRHTVEGYTAVCTGEPHGALADGLVPVVIDPEGALCPALNPVCVVDAVMAKRNTGTQITDAPVVIGLGPGFAAGADCHAVVETQRGHFLGRAIYAGSAAPDTGVPGEVSGATLTRVVRAPAPGRFRGAAAIGDLVRPGDRLGAIVSDDGGEHEIRAQLSGVVRGLLRDGVRVPAGLKVGDVDPSGDRERCFTISEKALAVGGGVLEALLRGTKERG